MTFEKWWDDNEHRFALQVIEVEYEREKALAKLTWKAAVNYTMAGLPQGHDEYCEFCGEICNGFAGNPGLWPLAFTHPDGTGVVKWHHTECVQDRIFNK